jgi:hypothetical protein
MQAAKPILLVVLLAAAALLAPSAAGAASGPETFNGTIITDAAGGERHIVKSVVVAHGAFNGVGAIVEVPNLPGDADNIFRDDLVFPQGTMHLVTTNLAFDFNVIPQSCRFTATVQQTGVIVGGTGLFGAASGNGAGGVVAHGTAARAADGSCDTSAPTPHEVDRINSTGTLSY